MTLLVPLLILSSVYVGSNKKIKKESKTGFFVVIAILLAVGILLSSL